MTANPAPSWPDARAAAEAMTVWHRRRTAAAEDDDQRWPQAAQLLALALWRIAADQDVTVANAVLNGQVFGYLRTPERLLAEPLPAELSVPPQLDGEFDPVLRCADRIMGSNFGQYPAGRGQGTSKDGLPDLLTVADRLDEIAQDPDGLAPLPETEQLDQCAAAAGTALNQRSWLPTDAERRLAQIAHVAIVVYPTEPVDDPFGLSWLARLRRLAHIGDTLRAVPTSHVSPLLTNLLGAITTLMGSVTEPLAQLETAWSTRPSDQRLPVWEREHVPLGLRSRIDHAEHQLFLTAATLNACITGDVDY